MVPIVLAILEAMLILPGLEIDGHTKANLKGVTLGTTIDAENVNPMACVLGLSRQ